MGSITGIAATGINFLHPEPYTSVSLALEGEVPMKFFIEKIEPPPPMPLTEQERLKLKMSEDDLWVKDFIDHLGCAIRELKRK
jgi:hypothetical protein